MAVSLVIAKHKLQPLGLGIGRSYNTTAAYNVQANTDIMEASKSAISKAKNRSHLNRVSKTLIFMNNSSIQAVLY